MSLKKLKLSVSTIAITATIGSLLYASELPKTKVKEKEAKERAAWVSTATHTSAASSEKAESRLAELWSELPSELRWRVCAYLLDEIPGAIACLAIAPDLSIDYIALHEGIGLKFNLDQRDEYSKGYMIPRPFAYQGKLKAMQGAFFRSTESKKLWPFITSGIGASSTIHICRGTTALSAFSSELPLRVEAGNSIISPDNALVAALAQNNAIHIFDVSTGKHVTTLETPDKFCLAQMQFVATPIAGYAGIQQALMVASYDKGSVVISCYVPRLSNKPFKTFGLSWPGFIPKDPRLSIHISCSASGMLIAPKGATAPTEGWDIFFASPARAKPVAVGMIHAGYRLGGMTQSDCGAWNAARCFINKKDTSKPEAMIQLMYLKPIGSSLKRAMAGKVTGVDAEGAFATFIKLQERAIVMRTKGLSLPPSQPKLS